VKLRAAFERLKQLGQSRNADRGTAAADVESEFGLCPQYADLNGAPWSTVMDGIYDEVTKHLPHSFPVPATLAIARDVEFDTATGIGDAQLFDLFLAQCVDVQGLGISTIPRPRFVRLKSTRSSSRAFKSAPLRISRFAAAVTSDPALS